MPLVLRSHCCWACSVGAYQGEAGSAQQPESYGSSTDPKGSHLSQEQVQSVV